MRRAVRVRHISDGDWNGIVALESSAYAAIGLSEERAALESRVHASPTTCFVLDCGQRLAGYLLALPYPMFQYPDLARTEGSVFHSRNLHLHDLVIAESLRGRGLAKHLLQHLVRTAGLNGYGQISLVAVAGTESFWSANGFVGQKGVVPSGSYGANAVYMSRVVQAHRTEKSKPASALLHGSPSQDEVG
jgi:GNAT superfamily N-acetyltransferase